VLRPIFAQSFQLAEKLVLVNTLVFVSRVTKRSKKPVMKSISVSPLTPVVPMPPVPRLVPAQPPVNASLATRVTARIVKKLTVALLTLAIPTLPVAVLALVSSHAPVMTATKVTVSSASK